MATPTTEGLSEPQFKKIRAGGKPGRVDPRGSSKSRNTRAGKLTGTVSLRKGEKNWGGSAGAVSCVHCGKKVFKDPPKDRPDLKLHQDRINPGGPYAYHNIQPSCPSCNQRRSNNPDWKYNGD